MAGIRLLDLSRHLPGPFLTRTLADLGADVVKVESPQGDWARYLPPFVADQSTAFAALNWGKRSIVLDLKKAEGREMVLALVEVVDVVVESFRPGVLDRLGLGADVLMERNAALIVCSLSGYGQAGPFASVPGHDINYMARSGVLSLFGPANGPPPPPGVQVADIGGGLHGAVAILAALYQRHTTGRGRRLDISLCNSAASFGMFEHARRVGDKESRGSGILTGGRPGYRVYETQDGEFMALGALEPKFFNAFCKRAGCEHLVGKGMTMGEEGAETMAQLETIFASHTRDEWVGLLSGCDCCCEPVLSPEEAATETGLPTVSVAGNEFLAVDLGAPCGARHQDVPMLGEHGMEVARELQLDPELVERAVACGAFWEDSDGGQI